MKKIITLLSIVGILSYGCSKSNNEDISKTADPPQLPSTITPHYFAPVEGALKVNVTSLTLHAGDNVAIIVTKTNGDGNVVTASNLVWSSSNTNTATVNNGVVAGKAMGNTEISVTDGVHGIISVNVNVVDDTTVIADKATQANLKQSVIIIAPNSTGTVEYTLYNAKGKVVTDVAAFLPPAGSGITFAGNKITASAKTGDFIIPIRLGTDTLQNAVRVLIKNSADTTYAITGVGSIPYFYQNDISSERPVLISVTKVWLDNGLAKQYSFIASPDHMTFADGNVNLDANGYLHSVHYTDKNYIYGNKAIFGTTDVNLIYKTTYFHCPVSVFINASGSYGKKISDDEEYNICITQSGPKMGYTFYISNYYNFNTNRTKLPISGTYYFKINGKTKIYNNSNLVIGTFDPALGITVGGGLALYFGDNASIPFIFQLVRDEVIYGDLIHYLVNIVYLEKNSGKCVAPTDTNDPTTNDLAWYLHNGVITKTWKGNDCFNDNFDPANYTFNKDGSGQEKELITGGSTTAFSWTTDTDNVITMTTAKNQILKFYVTKFSDTSLEFSKINMIDPNLTPNNQTVTNAQIGCTMGLVPQ